MEKAKNKLEFSKEEAEVISKLAVNPHRPNLDRSFYEDFSLRGIRVDRVDTEILLCSFKVPPRLTVRQSSKFYIFLILEYELGILCSWFLPGLSVWVIWLTNYYGGKMVKLLLKIKLICFCLGKRRSSVYYLWKWIWFIYCNIWSQNSSFPRLWN